VNSCGPLFLRISFSSRQIRTALLWALHFLIKLMRLSRNGIVGQGFYGLVGEEDDIVG